MTIGGDGGPPFTFAGGCHLCWATSSGVGAKVLAIRPLSVLWGSPPLFGSVSSEVVVGASKGGRLSAAGNVRAFIH